MRATSLAFLLSGLAAVRADVQLYGQCGGLEYSGDTACVANATCIVQNPYYYQCVLSADASGATAATPSSVTVSSSSSASLESTQATSTASSVVASMSQVTSTSPILIASASSSNSAASSSASASVVSLYGQCGGEGYTGSTTCVSGATCVYLNDYYYQCLDESSETSSATSETSLVAIATSASSSSTLTTTVATTSPTVISSASSVTSTSSTASSAASSAASSSTSSSSFGFKAGVNTAGYDFSMATDGTYSGTYSTPPSSQFSHFASEGATLFRIPFSWQLMTPDVGGDIDSSFFSTYDATVQAALDSGDDVYVILDLHNYARWDGGIVGQGGPTNDEFASLWSQMATEYADNDRIIFGIMNEPHDLDSLSDWADSVQAAVTAIREAGATTQYMLLPGSSYSAVGSLPTEAGPYLLDVTDPQGGSDKLLFDVHQYLDSDGSGTSTECTTDGVDNLETLVSWLQENNRQALLSETGGGSTSSCETYLKEELAYVKANSDYLVGFTAWAAGAFDTSYALTLTPNSDGTDQAIFTDAVLPNF